jgi:hypothetical protein
MRLFSKTIVPCFAALGVLSAAPIQAEVGSSGAPLPALESDPPDTVFPQSCSVSVVADGITVEMSVSESGEMPALLLNGPLFGWMGEADPYPDRHFPELEIRIDGAPVMPNDRFEAWAGKNNITNLVRAAEMDPWAVVRTPPYTSAHAKNSQVLIALRNAGAIEQAGDNYLAKWKVRRIVRIPLNAAPRQSVEFRYSARPGHSLLNDMEQVVTPAREREYCISEKQLRSTLRRAHAAGLLDVTEHAIATNIDDHTPSTVTLTLSGDAAATSRTAIFLCAPHGKSIAKIGTVTRQPAQVDEHGILHLLRVAETSAKSP